MQRYADWYRDNEGRGYPGGVVTVYDAGLSTLPQLYSANGDISSPPAISNPFTTDANGFFAFAVPNGVYDIHLQGGGMPETIIPNVTISEVFSSLGTFANPMTTAGDTLYGGSAGAPTRLAGNTTTTPKYLRSVGNGVTANAPSFTQIPASEVSNTPAGNITQTDSQAALNELDTLSLHKAGSEVITGTKTFSAQPAGITAASIVNVPAGAIAATDTQAAINEIVTDLADTASSSNGDALVGVKQPLTGAVARTQHLKNLDAVSVDDFGAVGDGVTDDTAAFLLASVSAGLGEYKTLELCAGKTYLVKRSHVFQMFDGASVIGNGATILVASDAVPQGDYNYGDGVIYVPTNTSVKDITIDSVNFDIRRTDIDAITIGVVGTAESAIRSNVKIINCYDTGGFNFLKTRQVKGMVVSGNNVYLTGEGIFAQECSGAITGNVLRYVGVSADLATWNNTQPIQVPAANGMTISGNLLEYAGGTAISTTSVAETYNVAITGNVILNAGYSGIGFGPKADGAISKHIVVTGNIIKGFCCAPLSDAHSGIAMVGVGVNSVSDCVIVSGNTIDFLGTYETYNTTTNDVEGSLNTKKLKGSVFGSTAALQCNGNSNGTTNSDTGTTIISDNIIEHAPSIGLSAIWLTDVTISGNKLRRCGYQRNGSNLPPSASVGINVTETGQTTITNNAINEMAPGCAGGNSFGIRLTRPWKTYIAGNQMWNSVATWCTSPLIMIGSAGGFSFYGLTGAKHEFHCEKNSATSYVSALAYTVSVGSYELTLAPGDRKLTNSAVGTGSTSLAHTLGKIPKSITVVPRGNVSVWQSAVPDATNIYLQAASATNVDVYLG